MLLSKADDVKLEVLRFTFERDFSGYVMASICRRRG